MAKVSAPLLSFAARGALARAIVFFPWKGIQAVRQYVIPANPQTALQIAQRTHFTEAVDEWHLAKYVAADRTAWNRYAGILANPMSGFNAFVQMSIAILRNALATYNPPWTCYLLSGGAGVFDAGLQEDGDASAAYFDWGYSKTAMNTRIALAEAPADNWTTSGVAATVGATVYGRFATWGAGGYQGYSGIYQFLIV